MTTITINERTKAGRTLLELAKILSASNKGVSINVGIENAVENDKNHYNPKFLAKIKLAEKQIKEGKTTIINTESIWESIQ